MPRTSATNTGATNTSKTNTGTPPPDEVAALASFLRRLAEQSERDSAFGAQLVQLAHESGLMLAGAPPKRATSKPRGTRTPAVSSGPALSSPPDPYAILREKGEEGLRATLVELDLAALRAIVRMHRLDPARTSARWTTRERLATFIAERVSARASHGRAFERV